MNNTLLSADNFSLTKKPVVSIRAGRPRLRDHLAELWVYRELLGFLTWRDVRVRYKQTLLGAAWAILQPVLTMLIFTLLFGRVAGVPSDGLPYSLFALAGLLLWIFLANSITNSGNSLVGSSHLITKVYFPRAVIPGSAVAAGLLDLAIGSLALLALMVFHEVTITLKVMLILPIVGLTAFLALGVGLWLSALNVKYRDIRHALPFLIQIWMFASPIIYPSSMLPERWRYLMLLNPLTGIIDAFRACLFGLELDVPALAIATALTFGIFTLSFRVFRRMERAFADVI